MPLLVFLSIISVSCWLNLAHGMNGKTDEKTESVQYLQKQTSPDESADSGEYTPNSVSSDDKSSETTPQQPVISAEILNLEYEESQIKFLSKLIPITKNFEFRYFHNYHKYYRSIKKNGCTIYLPKLNKGETICGWFNEVKRDITHALKNTNPDNSSIPPEQITTLKRLKETIDFYLNPINGRFKTSDVYKILADSNYQLKVNHHKRSSKIYYADTLLTKDDEPIDLLSKEELKHASDSSKSIQEIFNPESLTQDMLREYYEELDKRSDPKTINTRSTIYYALAHLCGAEHLKKYALEALLKKMETQKITTHETKQWVEHNNQDRIPKRSNPGSYGRPAAQGYTTTQAHKKHSSMRHESYQTPERSNHYRSDSEEPIKREVKITTVGGKPRVYRKLKRPSSTSSNSQG